MTENIFVVLLIVTVVAMAVMFLAGAICDLLEFYRERPAYQYRQAEIALDIEYGKARREMNSASGQDWRNIIE